MRTLLLLLICAGCAAKTPPPGSPLTEVQLRACDSCRQNLENCRRLAQSRGGAEGTRSGPVGAECMDEFMTCISQQQLDTNQCAGLN